MSYSIVVPQGADKVLLHCCCAPCSGAIIEALLSRAIKPVIFFSNSNIFPKDEYIKRLSECRRYADSLGVELVEDSYSHSEWREYAAKGLELEPERGERCMKCFRFRLLNAARYAQAKGIPVLTTSLASSRWKDLSQVDAAGIWACSQVGSNVIWWGQNWRKGGLQERRGQIIKEQNFYNQLWCGCEYSLQSS